MTEPASAFIACTADEVIAQEPLCSANPATVCNIRSVVDRPANETSCVYDFGNRAVVVGGTSGTGGSFRFGSGIIEIKAGSFTLHGNNSVLNGEAPGTVAPNDRGGMVSIETSGAVSFLGGSANTAVNLRGKNNAEGGTITISAGGDVTVSSRIDVSNFTNMTFVGGGAIRIESGRDVTVSGQLWAFGGFRSPGGGEVDVRAARNINVTGTVDFTGSEGGVGSFDAAALLTINTTNFRGRALQDADGGSGGSATLVGGRGVSITGTVDLQATNGQFGGGCGGFLDAEAVAGDIVFATGATILAQGGAPEGGGGELEFLAARDIQVGVNAQINVSGGTGESCGGAVSMEALRDLRFEDSGGTNRGINASGGGAGGDISLNGGRHAFIGSRQRVDATGNGGGGGTILIESGQSASGNLDIRDLINANGGSCLLDFCGVGGAIDVLGCDVTIHPLPAAGTLQARAVDSGQISISARKALTIAGTVNASRTTGPGGSQGAVLITHPTGVPPTTSGSVSPAAQVSSRILCTGFGLEDCLIPCPACGNGVLEFPETCDTAGTPVNCDGCDELCQSEPPCDDGLLCTTDTCDLVLGCIHDSIAGCDESMPNVSPTSTRTVTVTPTPTVTPPPTSTAVATSTPTRTATPSHTPPPQPCPGDCNGSGSVDAADVARIADILTLCNGVAAGCPAVPGADKQCLLADIDGNGTISAAELTQVVSNVGQFPNGCPP